MRAPVLALWGALSWALQSHPSSSALRCSLPGLWDPRVAGLSWVSRGSSQEERALKWALQVGDGPAICLTPSRLCILRDEKERHMTALKGRITSVYQELKESSKGRKETGQHQHSLQGWQQGLWGQDGAGVLRGSEFPEDSPCARLPFQPGAVLGIQEQISGARPVSRSSWSPSLGVDPWRAEGSSPQLPAGKQGKS